MVPELVEEDVPLVIPDAIVTAPELVDAAPEEIMTAPELPDEDEPVFRETLPLENVAPAESPDAMLILPEPPNEEVAAPVDTENAPDGVGDEVGEPPVEKETVPGVKPEPDATVTLPPTPEGALPAAIVTLPPLLVWLLPTEMLMLPVRPDVLVPVDSNNEPD